GRLAWPQNFGRERHFVGAPSPRDIAEVAFWRRLDGDEKLVRSTVARVIPCIIDGAAVPADLVQASVRRAFNPLGAGGWEWEKALGIACALVRGAFTERSYEMSLEEGRTTRDYLYGRLLAIAERLESVALYAAGETRDTTASRLMQRFADRPYSTWRT